MKYRNPPAPPPAAPVAAIPCHTGELRLTRERVGRNELFRLAAYSPEAGGVWVRHGGGLTMRAAELVALVDALIPAADALDG